MEKQKEDRRIQKTRKALQKALLEIMVEKGYEAVTVQDIIDRANVGRSTFYAHFQDKDDLFLQGFETLKDEIEGQLNGIPMSHASPWDLSLMIFEHVQGQQLLYKALSGNQAGNAAMKQVKKFMTGMVKDHLNQNYQITHEGQISPEILAQFTVSTFLTLLTWWLDTKSTKTPVEMNGIFRQLVEPAMSAVFQVG